MSTQEELDIEAIGDGCRTLLFMCRGHVDRSAFWHAVKAKCPHHQICVDRVETGYARWIPVKHEDYDLRLEYPVRAGRGAFPVTVWKVD